MPGRSGAEKKVKLDGSVSVLVLKKKKIKNNNKRLLGARCKIRR